MCGLSVQTFSQGLGATRDEDVNRAADSYGYSLDELRQMNAIDLRAPEEAGGLRETWEKVKERGLEGLVYETEHLRKDGSRLPVEVSVRVIEIEGREFWQAIIRDISRRKATEAALRESEEQFRTMTATAHDAIVLIDNDARIVFWNDAAKQIFGHPREEAIDKNIHDLLTPARYRERDRMAFRKWREIGQGAAGARTFELSALRKDGTEFPIELSLSSVRRNGQWSALGIIRDITSRKRAEDEVRQANEKLSGVVQKLKMRSVQDGVLGDMRIFLQACSSTEEIAPIVAHSMQRLFPDSDGALFLLSPSKTDLEAVVRWGESPEDPDENMFSPDRCWGLRRGGAYVVDDLKCSLICPHLKHLPAATYACLPLMAKGDVIGLLHLRGRPATARAEALGMIADLREMSSQLSELLSLSISNLRLSESLSIQSIRDPLTGLFNRRYMEETLQREIYRAARKQHEIGVVMADIDHFKRFNDLHGHAAGDLVLTQLAGLLKTRLRGTDIACRYGGEEFVFVFIESSLEDTVARASELKEEVKGLRLSYEGQEIGPIALSMGVSAYPASGNRPEELLRAADAALYRAKQAGRDRVVSAAG